MIEKLVMDYLGEQLVEPVHMEVPESRPARYVLVEKTGSGRTDLINRATIAIQSIAESMAEAAALNERVKAAMDSMIVLNRISRAALNSDYNFTDQQKHEYRYQAVYDLIYY